MALLVSARLLHPKELSVSEMACNAYLVLYMKDPCCRAGNTIAKKIFGDSESYCKDKFLGDYEC